MQTHRTIVTKRDTRAYLDAPIPDDVLRSLLQAARMAGSAKNRQPVRLVVVREQAQKEALATCGNYARHLPSCAAAIVFVLEPEGEVGAPFAIYRGPFDAGRAAQNLMLAAWEHGVASCPASLHDDQRAREILALPPGHVVANVIALGYPDRDQRGLPSPPRLPLAGLVHFERWGGTSTVVDAGPHGGEASRP